MMAFLLCLCLWLMPWQAQAVSTADAVEFISPEADCSLTLSYRSSDTVFMSLPVKLYKIATVSADFQYTPTASFADCGLILNGIQTVGEWNVVRSTVEANILAKSIPADAAGQTDLNGQLRFEGLKPGLYLAVTEPVAQDGYTYLFDSSLVALPGLNTDGRWNYHIAVTAKSEALPPMDPDRETELKVLKLWKGDEGKNTRPQSIQVEIFRNGVSYETVTLSEANQWSYTWKTEEDGATWMVVERNIPTGYTMTVEEKDTTFILTNTKTPDTPGTPPSSPPKTGDTSNILLYILLMYLSGISLIIFGLTGKRRRV